MIGNTEFSSLVNTEQSPGFFLLKKVFLNFFQKPQVCWYAGVSISQSYRSIASNFIKNWNSDAGIFLYTICNAISTYMLELNLIC